MNAKEINKKTVNNKKRAAKKNVAQSKKKKNTSKKSNPKVLKLLKWTSIIMLLVGIAIIICTTPMFNITKIEVKGNSKLSTNQVISLSKVKINDNIFKYSKKNISNAIKEEPYIKSVSIHKKYPDKIEITVAERKKVACVKVLNSYAYIDEEGYILEISEDRAGLTIIEGIATNEVNIKKGKRLVEEDLKRLTTALKIIEISKKQDIGEEIYSINIENNEFTIYLEKQKKLIYLGDASNLTRRIASVKEALEKITDKQGKLYAHGDLNKGFNLYFKEGEI